MFVAKMYTAVNKIQGRTEADKRTAARATNDDRTSQSAPVPGELLRTRLTSHYAAGGLTGMCVCVPACHQSENCDSPIFSVQVVKKECVCVVEVCACYQHTIQSGCHAVLLFTVHAGLTDLLLLTGCRHEND